MRRPLTEKYLRQSHHHVHSSYPLPLLSPKISDRPLCTGPCTVPGPPWTLLYYHSDQRPCSTCLTRRWQLKTQNAGSPFSFTAPATVPRCRWCPPRCSQPPHTGLEQEHSSLAGVLATGPLPTHSSPPSSLPCMGPRLPAEKPLCPRTETLRGQARVQDAGRDQSPHWSFGFSPLSHHWSEPCDRYQGMAFALDVALSALPVCQNYFQGTRWLFFVGLFFFFFHSSVC